MQGEASVAEGDPIQYALVQRKVASLETSAIGTFLASGIDSATLKGNILFTPDSRESNPSIDMQVKTKKGWLALLQVEAIKYSFDDTAALDPALLEIEGMDLLNTPDGHSFRKEADEVQFSASGTAEDISETCDPSKPWAFPISSAKTEQFVGYVQRVSLAALGVTTATNIRVLWSLVRGQRWQDSLAALRIRWRLVVITAAGASVLNWLGHDVVWPDPFPMPGLRLPPPEEVEGFVLIPHTL